ncbi:lonely Cys domain-containing protein [Streptomyces sp. NBC_00328]|nr:lonely Cys domain-containing protein [Streptomyces sp. NBC_00328]
MGALASREAVLDLARGLRELSGEVQAGIVRVRTGLPADVGAAYVSALRELVDDRGENRLRDLAEKLEGIAGRRVDISMQVRESKISMWLEVSLLLAQMQTYLALSFFTGGASLTAMAAVRARAVLRILLALQALSHSVVPLVGAPLEALEEALQSIAARLLNMASAPAVARPSGVDWSKVGQDALFGAFAGVFGEALGGATQGVVNKLEKKVFKDRPAFTVPLQSVHAGVVEGGAESLGEMFTVGVLQGRWAFSAQTAGQAGLSGVVSTLVLVGAVGAGKALHKWGFAPDGGVYTPAGTGAGGGVGAGTGAGAGGVNELRVLDWLRGVGAGLDPTVPAMSLPPATAFVPPSTVTSTTTPAAPSMTATIPSSVPAVPLSVPVPGLVPLPEPATDVSPTPRPDANDTGVLPAARPDVTSGQAPFGRVVADTGAAAGRMADTVGDVPTADVVLTEDAESVVSSVWDDRDDSDTASAFSMNTDYSDYSYAEEDVPGALAGQDGSTADRVAASLLGPDGVGTDLAAKDFTDAIAAPGQAAPADVMNPSALTDPTVGTAAPTTVPSPAQAPPSVGEPAFVRLTGEEPSGGLMSSPLPGEDGTGRGGGRAWLTGQDMELRQEHYRHLPAVRHRVIWDPVAGREGPLEPLDGPVPHYTAALHIGPQGAQLPLPDGRTGLTDGRGLGRILKRRPSMSRLAPGTRIRLLACTAGAEPGTDPLRHVPIAQDVATETGMTVDADTGDIAVAGPSMGRPARIGITDSLTDSQHHSVTFHPEPEPAQLEADAWQAGLTPGTGQPAERALRWLRALRRETGGDLGWNPDRRQEYETLLRAAMTRENTRLATAAPTSTTAGLLTQAELTRMLEDHRTTHPGATLVHALTGPAPRNTATVSATARPTSDENVGSPPVPAGALPAPPGPAPAAAVVGSAGDRAAGDVVVPETPTGPTGTTFADPSQFNTGRAGRAGYTDFSDSGSVISHTDTGEASDPVEAVVAQLIDDGLVAEGDRPETLSAVRVLRSLLPDGPFGRERMDHASRQVLSLEDDSDLEDAEYKTVLDVVQAAVNADRADSLPGIAAYFLTRAGALSEHTLVRDTHARITGRSWSGRLTGGTRLDPATVSRGVRDDTNGEWRQTPGSLGRAPWADRPVALLEADGDETGLTVELAGRHRRVNGAVLAELLRHDTAVFPAGTALLLTVTGADGPGTNLPGALAQKLDRWVWSPTAGLDTAGHDSSGGPVHLAFAGDESRETLPRRWLHTPPDPRRQLEEDPWAGQWLTDPATSGREWVPDSALRTYTIVPGADHEPHGHESAGNASFDPLDWAGREPEMRQLTAFPDFHFVDPATSVPVASRRAPWADALKDGIPLYTLALHGDPHGRLGWNLRDGRTMHGDAWQAGARLRWCQSLADMDARAPQGRKAQVLFAACHAGGPPAGTLDPLETPGPGQDFANGSGRRTYASPTPPGTSVESPADEEAPSVGFAFADAGFDGSLRGWQVYDPEPAGAELDTLSRALGAEPASAAAARPVPSALRLVRALRHEFGPLAEQDAELVAGIGALDRLRREDPVLSGTGAFTLEFLDEAARAYARQPGQTADTDPVALRRALLHDADRWWKKSQQTTGRRPWLTSYLRMPGARETSQQWAHGSDTLARDILPPSPSPDGTAAPLSEADRGRAFWSLTRARTAVDEAAQTHGLDLLTRRVLHSGPDAETAPDILHTLRLRVAQAYAGGYPDTDGPAAWEARDLEHRGVLDAAPDVIAGGQVLGRSLAGTVTADLEISGFRIGAPGTPNQPEAAPWQEDEVTIVEVAGVEADTVTVRHPGGELKATHGALAHLLAADLRREGDTTTRIVLVGPVSDRPGAERLAQAVADVTGRKTDIEPSGSALLPGPDGRHVITVAPGTTPTPGTDPAAVTPAVTADWLFKLPHRPHFESLRTIRRLYPPRTVGTAPETRTGYTPGFDIRRLPLKGTGVDKATGVHEATVLVEFMPADTDLPEAEQNALWNKAVDGVEELFNHSPRRFPDGTRLHVTLERVGPGQGAHLKVEPAAPQDGRPTSHRTWHTDAAPDELAARISGQLGLGDTWTPGPDGLTRADLDRLWAIVKGTSIAAGTPVARTDDGRPEATAGTAQNPPRSPALVTADTGHGPDAAAPDPARAAADAEGTSPFADLTQFNSGRAPAAGTDPDTMGEPGSASPTVGVDARPVADDGTVAGTVGEPGGDPVDDPARTTTTAGPGRDVWAAERHRTVSARQAAAVLASPAPGFYVSEPGRGGEDDGPELAAWPPGNARLLTVSGPGPVPVSGFAGIPGAPPPPEPSPPSVTAAPEPPPAPEAPWYLNEGALGIAFVERADAPSEVEATLWAQEITGALRPSDGADEALLGGLRPALRDLLLNGDPKEWNELLAKGRTLVVDGRLVWLRPQPARPRPRPALEKAEVREYEVGFAATSTGGETSREVAHGLEATLLGAIGVASGSAAAILPGLPAVSAGVSDKRVTKWGRSVISSRKPFIATTTGFDADLQVRIFIDGEELSHDVVTPRTLVLGLPADYSAPGAPRPDAAAFLPSGPATGPDPGGPVPRPPRAHVVLNALDTTAAVAGLMRALRAARLRAGTVQQIMTQVQTTLNETSALNRGRWLLTSGDLTNTTRAGEVTERSFRGHFRIRAEIEAVQYLGTTDGVGVRDDLGGGWSEQRKKEGHSSGGLGFFLSVLGLADGGGHPASGDGASGHSEGGHTRQGIFPAFGLRGMSERSDGHALTVGTSSHTVLTARTEQARYRTRLRLTVNTESPTHTIAPVVVTVSGELGMPQPQAAGFEHHLPGAVTPPGPAHPDQDQPSPPQSPPGPVDARPWVRALLRASGTDPVRVTTRPAARLDDRLPPHPREPLALALRRGQGLGMLVGLPGSELVLEQLRWAIGKDLGPRTRRADWATTDRDLAQFFGTPALEGDLPGLLRGFTREITVGGRRYRAGVRGYLRERHDDPAGLSAPYRRTINARLISERTAAGHRKHKWSLELGGGGAARLGFRHWLRLQLGAFRVTANAGRAANHELSGTAKVYRRTETDGPVDTHTYDIVYELSLSRPDSDGPGTADVWWIDRPGELVALVDVPHVHVPAVPLTPEQLAVAGSHSSDTATPPRADLRRVDFERGGTSGIYPAFLDIPELPRLAASLHALLGGMPSQQAEEWAADWRNWPDALRDGTTATRLATEIADLADAKGGQVIDLPERDGFKQAIRLRLTAVQPHDLGPVAGEAEIEHYLQAGGFHQTDNDTHWGVGLSGMAGPQVRVSAQPAADASGEGSNTAEPHGGGHESLTGRLAVFSLFGYRRGWSEQRKRKLGNVMITRATYGGTPHTVRATPVFEVTAMRWRGRKREQETRYLRVTDALDLLVPERRMTDLLPSATGGPADTGPRPGAEPPSAPEAVPGAPSALEPSPLEPSVPAVPVPRPPERRTVPYPAMLPGIAHPELLRADQVLDRIHTMLRTRGVLRDDPMDDRPNLLTRTLRDSYASHQLEAQHPLLITSGVRRWLPVPSLFGSTSYLWINVTGVHLPQTGNRPRPDVTLTLRSEGVLKEEEGTSSDREWSIGFDLRGQAGHGHRHAGGEVAVGYRRKSGRGVADEHDVKNIQRTSTKGTAHELTLPMRFRIEMGMSSEPPALVEAPVRWTKRALLTAGRMFGADGADGAERLWYAARPWVWYADSGGDGSQSVEGDVRLLVPAELTVPQDRAAAAPDPGHSYGTPRSWQPGNSTTPAAAPVRTVPQALVDVLHPWAVPAATAAAHWIPLTARHRSGDTASGLDDLRPPSGPTLGTLHELLYRHYTSEGMLRGNIGDLLAGRYVVPVGDATVVVGLHPTAARPLIPGREGTGKYKARRYGQDEHAPKADEDRSSGWYFAAGPEGGDAHGDVRVTERVPFELIGVEKGEKHESKLGETHESNKESVRHYRHYRVDARLVIAGPGGTLSVDVPHALYAKLPLAPDGETLADGVADAVPSLFATGGDAGPAVLAPGTRGGNTGEPGEPGEPGLPAGGTGGPYGGDGDAAGPYGGGHGEGADPAEALLAAVARGGPGLLTAEVGRELGMDPAAPVPPAPGTLRAWAGGVITDADVPAGAEPLADGSPVTIAELRAAGVPFDQRVEMHATLSGGNIKIGDVRLTTAQRYWLQVYRQRQDGPTGETVAALLGRRLGCRVVLAGREGPGPRVLGAPSGLTVLLTQVGDCWRASVVRDVEAVVPGPLPAPAGIPFPGRATTPAAAPVVPPAPAPGATS